MENSKTEEVYSSKIPVFDGEKFEDWKDRLESFFLGYDADLWDIVLYGYSAPRDPLTGTIKPRNQFTDDEKKVFKNHHKARTFLLNAISYNESEKITNRDSAKDILDSLRMTHEGNALVKESKALACIQKYESFRMSETENISEMFSRFQILVAGLRVLNRGYTTADHVKKIIRSLPSK